MGFDIILQDGQLIGCTEIRNTLICARQVDQDKLCITDVCAVIVDDFLELRSLRMTVRSGGLCEVHHQNRAQEFISVSLVTKRSGVRIDIDQSEVGDDGGRNATVFRCAARLGRGGPHTHQCCQDEPSHASFIEQMGSDGDTFSVTGSSLGTHAEEVYKGVLRNQFMRVLVLLLLATACTDYEVHSLKNVGRANWYDDASERYRGELDGLDTGWEEDTGLMDVGEAIVPEGSPDDLPPEDGSEGSDEYGDDSSSTDDDSSDDGASSGSSGSGTTPGTGSGGTTTPGSARGPGPGEMIFTELMIHPRATDDSQGEWVELRNVGTAWVDLADHQLGDRGVDGVEIVPVSSGSLMVAPGEYLTICAVAEYWDNGGVDCDGTFHYWTLGGGFAMSNTEDEARLLSPDGSLVDEVRYTEGFSSEGEALGLRPGVTSALINDDEDAWCDQRSFLSFGDAGTPGQDNDNCW